MRRPAKTRLAGTLAAIPICAILSGVATSQTTSPVLNNQINLGDVFSEQTLNVQTVSEGFSATTTAPANSALVSVQDADATMTSNQDNSGVVLAHGVVNLTGVAGAGSNMTTVAAGNSGTAAAVGGTLSAFMVQRNLAAVTARSQLEADDAEIADVSISTLASGNTQGLALVNGSAGARITQNNQANVLADGGAVVRHITGTAAVSGVATANNISLSGSEQSAARVIIDQANTSAVTQASKFAAYGNSYLTSTAATASGNNLSASNEGPLLDVASHQYNTAYVRAQAEETSYQFGGAQVVAQGVGNSAMVGNYGQAIVLDNVQTNDGGGVEVIASFSGDSGYDAVSTATAMGNAVTGYSCSLCSGTMSVNNTQANNVDVAARSTVTVGRYGRSIVGVSTATGNNASFYVSSPGN
jgi:hypothetical protein